MRLLLFFLIIICASTNSYGQSNEKIRDEVWQKELEYWQYVKNNDTAGYLTLWHDNFIGYPDSDRLSGKDKISEWIPEAHNRKGSRYEFVLEKKMVNPFGDVVITFYDETDIWKNEKNEITFQEVCKVTHTWKKFGDKWLIIGGMSAVKRK